MHNDNDNDDNHNDQDDPRDIQVTQVTYIVPGKRRRTTTLTRWNAHALRHMRQRLEDHGEAEERWESGGNGDSSSDSATPHGHTRDEENDVTRVGVT